MAGRFRKCLPITWFLLLNGIKCIQFPAEVPETSDADAFVHPQYVSLPFVPHNFYRETPLGFLICYPAGWNMLFIWNNIGMEGACILQWNAWHSKLSFNETCTSMYFSIYEYSEVADKLEWTTKEGGYISIAKRTLANPTNLDLSKLIQLI